MPAQAQRSARQALRVAALGLVALLVWELGAWDLAVTRWYGNAGGFAWRDAWWLRSGLHDGGRLLAWALLALLAVDALRPLVAGPSRRERGYWLAVALACVLLVPAIKRFSTTSCPWDLQAFGGHAAYVPHWVLGLADGGPGHCFPSGHAVAAFGFLGGYFLWRPHRPRLARAWLAGVLLAGALFGWAQLARGAHFVSHTLWSAWLCWAVTVVAHWAQVWVLQSRALRSGAHGGLARP